MWVLTYAPPPPRGAGGGPSFGDRSSRGLGPLSSAHWPLKGLLWAVLLWAWAVPSGSPRDWHTPCFFSVSPQTAQRTRFLIRFFEDCDRPYRSNTTHTAYSGSLYKFLAMYILVPSLFDFDFAKRVRHTTRYPSCSRSLGAPHPSSRCLAEDNRGFSDVAVGSAGVC